MSDSGSSKLREQRAEIESVEPSSWRPPATDRGLYLRFH